MRDILLRRILQSPVSMLASASAQCCLSSCISCHGSFDLSRASLLLNVPRTRHTVGSCSSVMYGLRSSYTRESHLSRVGGARLLMQDESLPDSSGTSRFPAQEKLKWSGPQVGPEGGATPDTDRSSDRQEEGPDERAAVSAFLRELELLDSPSFAAPPVRSQATRADDGEQSRSPISLPRSSRGLRKWTAASRPLFGKAEGLTTRAEKWVPARERRGELPRRLVRAAPLAPVRVMVFIDGSWLFCSLHERGRRCLIKQLYGYNWEKTYHIDFGALPQIISDRIASELLRSQSRFERPVEVVRTHVYSSLKPNPSEPGSIARKEMFDCMREQHFDVHLGDFTGSQEKCVDIALAVDMLHYATTPDAFDVAVLVSGDADFLPALVRTRQKGKRVAVCSMRNSAAADFESPDCQIKDFDVIWLDDHLPQLVSPIPRALMRERPALVEWLRTELIEFVDRAGGGAQERQLRQHLSQLALGESADCNALAFLEHEFGGLRNFILAFRDVRLLRSASAGGFRVSLGDETDETDETEAENDAARRALRTRPARRVSEGVYPVSGDRGPVAPSASVQRAGGADSDVGERTRENARAVAQPLGGRAEEEQEEDAAQEESAGGSSSFLLAAESCLFDGERDDRAGAEAADAQAASGDADEAPFEDESLSSLTVPQLRAVLKGMELPVSGSKPALIRRVLQARSRYDKS